MERNGLIRVRLSRNEATSPKRCFTRALADALPI